MGPVTDVLLPLALAFIMFALGIGLTLDDFTRVARQPRDFLIGAAAQMLLLPLVAFTLVTLWPMHPELALGVIIIAAAPGGVTSNILTAFAKGDVALSISLTAITSLLSVLTVPLIVTAAYAHLIGDAASQDVSITRTALSVFAIVTVPVLLGLAVRRFCRRLCPTLRTGSPKSIDGVVRGRARRCDPSRARQHRHILRPGWINHAGPQHRHDVTRLFAGFALCLRSAPAHRNIAGMRVAKRYAGNCRCSSVIWRWPRDRSGGDLQPDHVRNRSDLRGSFAPIAFRQLGKKLACGGPEWLRLNDSFLTPDSDFRHLPCKCLRWRRRFLTKTTWRTCWDKVRTF
jgi:hypothetical protein